MGDEQSGPASLALSTRLALVEIKKITYKNLYTPLLFCLVVCIWKTEVRYEHKK